MMRKTGDQMHFSSFESVGEELLQSFAFYESIRDSEAMGIFEAFPIDLSEWA